MRVRKVTIMEHIAPEGWNVEIYHYFNCVARSDGGIDDRRESTRIVPVKPENIVYESGEAKGAFVNEANRVLAPGESFTRMISKDMFVGGWGDVTEYYRYTLKTN